MILRRIFHIWNDLLKKTNNKKQNDVKQKQKQTKKKPIRTVIELNKLIINCKEKQNKNKNKNKTWTVSKTATGTVKFNF